MDRQEQPEPARMRGVDVAHGLFERNQMVAPRGLECRAIQILFFLSKVRSSSWVRCTKYTVGVLVYLVFELFVYIKKSLLSTGVVERISCSV